MAKVKDRLIFETKKMEAVAQRKSNKEHKLRAREAQANRAAEKSKRKREHFTALDEWAQSAAAKRGRRTVDDDDEGRLRAFGQPRSASPGAPNKKRIAAERKFGFGGKRGRFKQNDRKTLNDTSTFNPRGSNFSGGTKITSKGKGSGGGGKGKRPGKRARDAKRSKR
jgi:rRNA-processing protein EBP2